MNIFRHNPYEKCVEVRVMPAIHTGADPRDRATVLVYRSLHFNGIRIWSNQEGFVKVREVV